MEDEAEKVADQFQQILDGPCDAPWESLQHLKWFCGGTEDGLREAIHGWNSEHALSSDSVADQDIHPTLHLAHRWVDNAAYWLFLDVDDAPEDVEVWEPRSEALNERLRIRGTTCSCYQQSPPLGPDQ